MEKKLQVAIVLYEGLTTLDAVGPYDVLQVLPNVEVAFVSHKPGPYSDQTFLTLTATHSFDEVPRPDVVVVPGGGGTMALLEDEKILNWLRQVHENTLYTTSVCTGSLLLGAAGLLKGLNATTHYAFMEYLAKTGAKPTDKRVVREGKILTAAGVSSGIDMALTLAALITDDETAKAVQLFIEYDPQPPFNSGSVSKAGPDVVKKAEYIMSKMGDRLTANAPLSAA